MTGIGPEPRLRHDDGLRVFVPGIMGAGILLSAIIIIGDALRRILPGRATHRDVEVARGVEGLVTGTANAAGLPVDPSIGPRRVLRSRVFYSLLGIGSSMAATLLINGGIAVYTGEGGLAGNPWPLGWGIGAGTACALVAAGALAVAVAYRRLPDRVRRFVALTPVGRFRPPAPGYEERARRLAPSLREGGTP